MKAFSFESVDEAFIKLLDELLKNGSEVSPRGMLTKELSPISITITNPHKRVLSNKLRKLNYGFMVGELLWILQGRNDVDSVSHYNKQWLNFSDDGEILNGAYGQRIFKWDGAFDIVDESYDDEEGNSHPSFELQEIIVNQFENVYKLLKEDKYTRQATISMFDPSKDFRKTKDKPCTNLLRFSIRNDKLNMITFMRSNDIWLGFPYDVFNFMTLQEILANRLGIEVGEYTHIVDSFHLYETHFDAAKKIIKDYKQNGLYSAYDENNYLKSTLTEETLDEIMMNVYNVEATTRSMSNILTLEAVEKLLYKIDDMLFRSLAAVIATYNFRKARRSNEELSILKNYIGNEFGDLISNWEQLK